MALPRRKEVFPEGHFSQEMRCVHPIDDRLRAAGFRIFARPKKIEARWKRDGKVYTESQALEELDEEV